MEPTQFETCIVCGKQTTTPIDMHIDFRTGYIEGAGQLCHSCYTQGTDRRQILIPTSMIYNTPNDQELGSKVRKIYNQLEGE